MCGSSLAQADIDKLLDGAKCELTFIDPPYQLGGILGGGNGKGNPPAGGGLGGMIGGLFG